MQALDELTAVQGVQGVILIELPGTILRSTFDDSQTTQLIKAALPLIQNSIKLIPGIRLGQVRSMKREIVYVVEGNNIVIALVNIGGQQ